LYLVTVTSYYITTYQCTSFRYLATTYYNEDAKLRSMMTLNKKITGPV